MFVYTRGRTYVYVFVCVGLFLSNRWYKYYRGLIFIEFTDSHPSRICIHHISILSHDQSLLFLI